MQPALGSVYQDEHDIQIGTALYGGPCESSDPGFPVATGCSGVHAAAIEAAAFDDGSTYGDVWAVVYWNSNQGLSFGAYDTRRGLLANGTLLQSVTASVNRAGHTATCSVGGYYPSSTGCGWFVGGRTYLNVPRVHLIQARSIRPSTPPAGVGWSAWQNWAVGWEPAGDGGERCAVLDLFRCVSWSRKLLVVFASQDRTQLRGQFVNTDGSKLGSEFQVASGTRIRAPQVAWQPSALGDIGEGKWLVAYEALQDVPGGTAGYIHTVVVSWNGTPSSPTDIYACEDPCTITGGLAPGSVDPLIDDACTGELAAEGAGPLHNDVCICHGMWLAASTWPSQALLHEYFYDHLLDWNGSRLSTDATSTHMYWAVAVTGVPGYQFQHLNDSYYVYPYAYVGQLLYPADTTPPEDPWYDGRQVSANYQVSWIPHTFPQGLRSGSLTSGAIFSDSYGPGTGYIYLTVLDNR